MIKIKKSLRKEQGLYLIITEIDAKAAEITEERDKDRIEQCLTCKLEKVIANVTDDTTAKKLKDFLVERVFSHYVDMVAILKYVYDIRKLIEKEELQPVHNKFLLIIEFKNFNGPEEKDQKEEEEENV